MKKFLLVSLLVLSIVATAVCLVACNPEDEGENTLYLDLVTDSEREYQNIVAQQEIVL